jgi:predicted nucleic acid-binding protein
MIFVDTSAWFAFFVPVLRAWVFFQPHAAAGWSFTDGTNFVVMTELGIRKAAALDAHFQQFPNVQTGP